MGERPVHVRQFDQKAVSLKEELARVCPELEEMQERKSERRNQFIEVQEQIQSITNEIYSPSITASVDETDLSLRKLEEFQTAFCISKGEAPRSSFNNVGALEFDGYTSGRATDVSEFYL
ncbi:hypothetical protein GLYMA_16G204266v4 [Glycine max]|uniref:65-kDa microtubule-associated protein 3 n=1 Tax=Glycine max TaxID=3847 RepID=UPI0007191D52|nr:65-kDa microtubule-associated protein 3-like [Glycine max]KAG4380610.1 hypothetical protein GLYMA_16G204266v4 [Glycine max]KAH1152159.1 hypothetical protein GYH30_045585 [Glycine max]